MVRFGAVFIVAIEFCVLWAKAITTQLIRGVSNLSNFRPKLENAAGSQII
jgi:hypothetical protein